MRASNVGNMEGICVCFTHRLARVPRIPPMVPCTET